MMPPPHSTAYFSRKPRLGEVLRVPRIRVFVPRTAFVNLAVWLAIPERCCRKLSAVCCACKTLTAGPDTRATSWPLLSGAPSVARASKLMLLSTSSKTRRKKGRPARTPSSFAISLPRALTLPGNRAWVVMSPSPTSSASASLISLSTALMGKRMVMTGGGTGLGAGVGAGGGVAGRGGMPGGRPAVRQGDPRPRMVGRGKGMIGTPGGSGGCGGGRAGWGFSLWGNAGARGSGDAAAPRLAAGLVAGRAATAVLRATEAPLVETEPVFGRADLALGFAFTFEVVVRPFAFERRSCVRPAPLRTRRYRSTLLSQV